jgi:serine/threonine-protein kinase HipA
MTEVTVEVFVQLNGEDVLAGQLRSHRRRGIESATFAYAETYLARPDAYELDPSLRLRSGQQQTAAGQSLFAAFSDCAPDRWGRKLLTRAEQHRVDRDGGAARSFGEIDFLLGVRDDLRQGALRFRIPGTDRFVAEESRGVPALIELSDLLSASTRLERDEASDEDLDALLHAGSSLGGARPKAHVVGSHGCLAIAKFPSTADQDWDVISWEAVASELARQAGIRVANAELHHVGRQAVLILDRFDRHGELRIGYVSAMTMLEASEGDTRSYLEIANVIEADSPQATADLHELWRRIAFSILISNTDDHLRNHGFLRTDGAGWKLSPAFDLNPNPRPGAKHLTTAIDLDDTAASIPMLMRVAEFFRLDVPAAQRILEEVATATSQWRVTAKRFGLSDSALALMAPAFENDQTTHK